MTAVGVIYNNLKQIKMKILIFITLLMIFTSCNNSFKTINTPKDTCVAKISVTTALVSKTEAFGWVGKGSNFYSPENAQKGYAVQLKYCDAVVSNYFCPISELAKYIDIVKYEMSIKDSVVFKEPLK